MSMHISMLFIEDDQEDMERYARLLSEAGKISVTPFFPPEKMSELPLTQSPDVVLIDYRLTSRQPSGSSAPYRGGTLANFIRERLPDIPLIILSTRDVLKAFPHYEEDIQSIDVSIFKSDVNHNPQYWKGFIMAIVQGFRSLVKSKPIRWKAITELMKAESMEEENLQWSGPPSVKGDKMWSVHNVFRWIHRVLFRYPGIFYDSLYSSTSLGIEEQEFLSKDVESTFEPAIYTGIFADIKRLWWRDRLQRIAFHLIKKWKLPPIQSESFVEAFKRETSRGLRPSTCVYSKEENADTVCCVLGKPVKMKYTLGYLIDDRPEAMDPARISFKAILEEDIDESLIPIADFERLKEIRGRLGC